MSQLSVVLLGTGSPLPDPHRAGPASLVRAAGRHLLVDCGRGVLMRLAGAGLGAGQLDALVLTHLHSDHVTDLTDVITTRWVTSFAPSPLTIVGPPGTATLVERVLASLADDVGYRLSHHADLTWEPPVEVHEVADGEAWSADGVSVTVAPTDHRPVAPTIGVRVDVGDASVVLAGDTVPCPGLDRLVAGATVYVQTVVRPSLIEPIPMERFRDVLDYHSSLADAGATATRGGVRTLVLTHCVPAPAPGTEPEWIAEAAAEFSGEILLAADLDEVVAAAS
ncbi:MAG TPA: ribonuclease Z [Acidimicrobiales bacterium]|nr:ribonuclease Z [Acidimicrobiales bacterium]